MAVSRDHLRYELREQRPADRIAEPTADPAQQPMFDGGFQPRLSLT